MRDDQGEPDELLTDDGVRLAATRYRPSGPADSTIVLAGATAVPRGFYRRFGEHAARAGFEVITLDYRGTGGSRPASLRGYRMTFADWAEHDIPAAIEAATPDRPIRLVGHSYGGTALGLVPAADRLTGAYTFGAGTGWVGWMTPAERRKAQAGWALGTVTTALLGYTPWGRIMGGEDLPAGAFRGWKRWTGFPRFIVDDPREPGAAARYAAIRIPLVYATAIDDPWATPASRDAMLANFTGAPRTAVDLRPADLGLPAIGHMGYFRAGAESLWDAALTTLAG